MEGGSLRNLFWLCVIVSFFINKKTYAQAVDLEHFYEPKFKVTGTVNANTMYYKSSLKTTNERFTYLLSGNINISAFSFNIPLFYSITNQGDKLGYTAPFDFNRLSIMPKYKWVKGYIGNVSMTFSPYTLSGLPFKGLGLELTPNSPFKINLMGGQLMKAVTSDEALGGIPVYQRYGYGAKIAFEKEQYKIGWIGFYAKDNINSLPSLQEDKGATPKENWVNSLSLSSTLMRNLNFNVEYAMSILTDDIRAKRITDGGFKEKIFSAKESTSYKNALNVNLDYSIQKSKVGLMYERVDPSYSTLGALYFNNDLENIAFRFSRPFYHDKITVSSSLGFQRDDLANVKKQNTKRVVGSVNMNYKVTDQINFTGSYSNFSTYTNKKLNQFELINNPNVIPADTLDYRQLSQNANMNVSYIFGANKNQNLNFNYSIAGQANEQGGIIRRGQASTIQNYNVAHAVNFTASKVSLNSSLNYTNNQVGISNNSSVGASVGASKRILKDKMNVNAGLLYNNTQGDNTASSVFGIRANSSYILLKKHNFNMSLISQFRSSSNSEKVNDLTATFNYSYTIDKLKLPERREKKKEDKLIADAILKINYKKQVYEGTRNEILNQLTTLQEALRPMPKEDTDELAHLLLLTSLTPDDKSFKDKALIYLEAYDANNNILDSYTEYISRTVKSLQREMIRKDEIFENGYVIALGAVNKHKMHSVAEKDRTDKVSYNSYLKLVARKNKKLEPLLIHRLMLKEISALATMAADEINLNENISNFNKQVLSTFFKLIKEKKIDVEIIEKLKIKLIPFYHELATQNVKNDEVEFKFLRYN